MRKQALKAIRIFAIQAIIILLAATLCSARDWYVRPNGNTYGAATGATYNDALSGFAGIPWASINPGDRIYIAGTFNESLTFPKSGTAGNLITVYGSGVSSDPGIISVSSGNAVNMNYREYVAIDGVTINRAGTTGVYMQSSKHCEVRNCGIYGIGAAGSGYGVDGRYAQGMHIYNNRMTNEKGAFNGAGVVANLGNMTQVATSTIDKNYIYGTNVDGIIPGNDCVVSRNTVGGATNMNTHGDGIVIYGSRVLCKQNTVFSCTQGIYPNTFDMGGSSVAVCDDVTIADNVVYQTPIMAAMNGILAQVWRGPRSSMKRLKIYNNTVVGINQYGIHIADDNAGGGLFDGLQIYNNIVIDSGTRTSTGNISVLVSGTIPNLKIDYNVVGQYHSPTYRNYKYNGTWYTQAQMRSLGFDIHGVENPTLSTLFRKYGYQATDNDLSLPAGSPAIGMALNLGGSYAYDRNGAARSSSGNWDAGAYASGSSGTNPGGSPNRPSPPKNLRMVIL